MICDLQLRAVKVDGSEANDDASIRFEEVCVTRKEPQIKRMEEGETRRPYQRFREKKFVCDLCDQHFTMKQNVQQHILTYHALDHCVQPEDVLKSGQRRRIKCKSCNQLFRSMDNAQRHYLIKHRVSEKTETNHDCVLCNRLFPSRSQLIEHVDVVHLKKRDYICGACGGAFGRRGGLRRHIRMVHEGRTVSCPYPTCVHAPYKCPKALAAHVRAHHTFERPFKCDVCEKAFVRSNDLKVHKMTHQVSRRIECASCGATFRRNAYLQRHMKTCKRT